MKKIITFLILMTASVSFAKIADSKNFPLKPDFALMTTINAISKLNYEIVEIQSKSGYVLFKKGGDEYLAIISDLGSGSNIKIEKVKNSSPLYEIREKVFNKITDELECGYTRAD